MLAKRRIGISRYSLAIGSAISFASRLLGFAIVESARQRRKRYRVRRMTKVNTPSASVDSTSS